MAERTRRCRQNEGCARSESQQDYWEAGHVRSLSRMCVQGNQLSMFLFGTRQLSLTATPPRCCAHARNRCKGSWREPSYNS